MGDSKYTWFEKNKGKLTILICICLSAIIVSFWGIYSENKFISYSHDIEGVDAIEMEAGKIYKQEIRANTNTFSEILIKFGTYGRINKGKITVTLYKDDLEVESWTQDTANLSDNGYCEFSLNNACTVSEKSQIYLTIIDEYEGVNGVALWTGKSQNASILYQADEIVQDKNICYKIGYLKVGEKRIVNICAVLLFICLLIMIILHVNELIIMSALLIVLGLFYFVTTPPGTLPDEDRHFYRAFEISCGSLLSQHVGEKGLGGNIFPESVGEYEDKEAELDWSETKEFYFTGASLYSPISYLPQVVGIKIARIFTNKVFYIFYAGRLSNFIVTICMFILALYFIPFGRKSLFVIMVFPLTLQEIISMSSDGFTMGLAFFLIAYILNLSYLKKKVEKRHLIILGFVSLALALCKIVYIVVLLLLFIIPGIKFTNKKKSLIFKIGVVGSAVLANLIWLGISSQYIVEFQAGVDTAGQIKYILTHWFDYYAVVVRSVIQMFDYYIASMIGSSLGALCINTAPIVWVSFLLLFIYELLEEKDIKFDLHKYDKNVFLLTFLLGVALIFTSLYAQWTPYREPIVHGIQGRYFTPILLVFVIWFKMCLQEKYHIRNQENEIITGKYMYVLIATLNGIALLDLIAYYM